MLNLSLYIGMKWFWRWVVSNVEVYLVSTINDIQFYSLVYLKRMLYIIVSLDDCKFPAVLRQVYII